MRQMVGRHDVAAQGKGSPHLRYFFSSGCFLAFYARDGLRAFSELLISPGGIKFRADTYTSTLRKIKSGNVLPDMTWIGNPGFSYYFFRWPHSSLWIEKEQISNSRIDSRLAVTQFGSGCRKPPHALIARLVFSFPYGPWLTLKDISRLSLPRGIVSGMVT